ncbi:MULTISPECIES: DUF5818 domain-containing protein [Sphingobium]|nr:MULTISPECIES: DUF5818 domain-containing protein [Sphingobium]WBQ18927.1 DUF5818 domain-containing protein [Sphingobium yanoikuyae]
MRVDDGGEWRLNCIKSCRHLLSQRVRILGLGSDFDMIDIERIEPA